MKPTTGNQNRHHLTLRKGMFLLPANMSFQNYPSGLISLSQTVINQLYTGMTAGILPWLHHDIIWIDTASSCCFYGYYQAANFLSHAPVTKNRGIRHLQYHIRSLKDGTCIITGKYKVMQKESDRFGACVSYQSSLVWIARPGPSPAGSSPYLRGRFSGSRRRCLSLFPRKKGRNLPGPARRNLIYRSREHQLHHTYHHRPGCLSASRSARWRSCFPTSFSGCTEALSSTATMYPEYTAMPSSCPTRRWFRCLKRNI